MISYDSLRDKMKEKGISQYALIRRCLLYTSDAADEL